MRLPHPPSGSRFYAQVVSAICECPRCGYLLTFGSHLGRRKGNAPWNPKTAQLQCPRCELNLIIGLLAWPVRRGGGARRTPPRDQVPSERELAQLRARGAGLWMPQEQAKGSYRPDDTNITARCTCPEEGDRVDPYCPLHGADIESSDG